MHPITIEQTLAHGGTHLVFGTDAQRRNFVGFACGEEPGHRFVFVQVDRVTLREIQDGVIDLHTVMSDRCSGLVIETTAEAAGVGLLGRSLAQVRSAA